MKTKKYYMRLGTSLCLALMCNFLATAGTTWTKPIQEKPLFKDPIMQAIVEGRLETVQKYMARGGDILNAERELQNHYIREKQCEDTLLHLAASKGCLSIVEHLIENKFLSIRGCDGFTALHYAAAHGHVDIVEYLVKKALTLRQKILT